MSDESIFAAALAISHPAKRADYLNQACDGNPQLRREMDALLAAHAGSNPLDRPPAGPTGTYQSNGNEPPPASVGEQIGPYRLMEQIGEGGFGLVFVAEQQRPVRRKVALKVLKPGMDTRDVVARFEAERQALALMDHPNIAKVFDAGSTASERPYFVMELVRGIPITNYCDEQKLPPRDRLALFAQVCQAVQHAHQKGIIHRDLKPSNVLVTVVDGAAVPKVIDFGIAKAVGQNLTDKTIYTRFTQLVGTPLYMSPEQAQLSGVDVDTRADIYALGVLLYELLTGTTPFDSQRFRTAALDEIRRIIREEDPPKPSTRLSSLGATLGPVSSNRGTEATRLTGLVRGELDWIVMKALEKDRTRRYETANGLAKDVQRYLGGDAVEACPPTLGYRLRKAYRRNRVAVLVGSTIAAVLLVATAVSLAFGIQAKRAEHLAALTAEDAKEKGQIAQRERDEANAARLALEAEQNSRARSDYVSSILFAQAAWQQYQIEPTRRFLDRTRPELRGWEWHYLNRLCQRGSLDSLRTAGNHIWSVQYSQDGRWIVTVSGNSVQIWDTATHWDTATQQPFTLCSVDSGWPHVDIGPDGQQVLVSDSNKVTIWDLASRTAQPPIVVDPDEQNLFFARFSPDGTKIAIARNIDRDDRAEVETVALWDAKTRQRIWSYKEPKMRSFGASFAADGRWVYSMLWNPFAVEPWKEGRILKIWDVSTGEELLSVGQKFELAYLSPDGSRLAAMDTQNQVTVWRIRRDGNRPVLDDVPIVLRGHTGTASPRTFSRDSKYLLTAGVDDTVRIWDAATGAELRVLVSAGFSWADFSPDSQHVVTGSLNEGIARVWSVKAADPQVVSQDEEKFAASVPSPDGRLLLSFDPAGAKVMDARTRALLHTLADGKGGWSADSRRIWISSSSNPASGTKNRVRVYNAETGQLLHVLEGVETPRAYHCCNADGTQMLAIREDGSVNVWDTSTGETWELEKPSPGNRNYQEAGYSPDGTRIFVGRWGEESMNGISILDAETRKPIVQLETGVFSFRSNGTFSQDSRQFLGLLGNSESSETVCQIWDATTGKRLRSYPVNAQSGLSLEISPDSSRLLITGFLESVHLIDAQTGDELLVIPISGLREARFDRDGNKIIVNDGDKIRILDGTPMPESKQ